VSSTTELSYHAISEAAALIQARALSPVELTQACLDRIGQVEPKVQAFVRVLTEPALAAARQAEAAIGRGDYRGPLHGVPIALKDLYHMQGIPTTASSKVRADYVPTYDAAATERLADAGAILLGKVTTHEFAYGIVSPPTRNPWDLDRIPGGSSGGSGAALAAGECLGALGSDTGGSIRIPSSFCGVTGIKPTFGRTSKYGVTPLAYSLDHVGPMTRTVADTALMLQAISGGDPRDRCAADREVPDFSASLHDGVQGLVFGMPTNVYFDNIDPEVETAVRQAIALLEREGAIVKEVTLPSLAYALAAEFAIFMSEASSYHQRDLRASPDLYTPDVRLFLELGELLPATTYLKAQRARRLIKHDFRRAFEEHGLSALLAPTTPGTAPRYDQETYTFGTEEPTTVACVRLCGPANLTGLPALSVPCGFSSTGLPIGLQIIGRPFDEATVLRIGQTYEAVTDWTSRHPAL
jgi:aspartyl-tRNA(Asn)/glutamyl-tRNA(Gln) amidotransferase subunit A